MHYKINLPLNISSILFHYHYFHRFTLCAVNFFDVLYLQLNELIKVWIDLFDHSLITYSIFTGFYFAVLQRAFCYIILVRTLNWKVFLQRLIYMHRFFPVIYQLFRNIYIYIYIYIYSILTVYVIFPLY